MCHLLLSYQLTEHNNINLLFSEMLLYLRLS
ncbi:hypothetical protein VPHK165_0031 [Vibrio phage K165]